MSSTSTDLLERITSNPENFDGKPIIRDLRISVKTVLTLLARGSSRREILEDYPALEIADIHACLIYAQRSSLENEGQIDLDLDLDRLKRLREEG